MAKRMMAASRQLRTKRLGRAPYILRAAGELAARFHRDARCGGDRLNMGRVLARLRRAIASTTLIALIVICAGADLRAETKIDKVNAYQLLIQLGRKALAANSPQKAAHYFMRARQIAPLDAKAQLSIAEAFSRSGQARRSEAFLKHLLRDPAQRPNAGLYLQALDQLMKRHPFVASGSLAILPSTNVSNTSSETKFETLLGRFDIDGGGEETSGVGLEYGVEGRYRRPIGKGVAFELGVALTRVWYAEAPLRYWRGRVTADLTQIRPERDLRGGIHLDRSYFTGLDQNRSDRMAVGVHAGWSTALTRDTRLSVSGVLEHRRYIDKDSLSGGYGSVAMTWSSRLDDGSGYYFGGSLERSHPKLGYHRYFGASLRSGYDRNLSSTLRAGVDSSVTLRHYDETFAALNFARRDEIYRLGFSVSDSRLTVFDATPKLSCGYRVQSSNVALYTANAVDCRIGWAYRF